MSLPQWKGLFDWSIKYQDGTTPSDWDPNDYDPEKMKWLERVLKHYMQDFAVRMKQIKEALDTDKAPPPNPADEDSSTGGPKDAAGAQESQPLTLADKEALLDELMEIVSSIDFARDLHKIGGLQTLLDLLSCDQPSLQWRAAEVVATCVANNPPVQQWFLDGGVLPKLLRLIEAKGAGEPDATLRAKGLLAVSGLVRHSAPALQALCDEGGVAKLGHLAADSNTRVQRKAFSLLQYIASQMPSQTGVIVGAGAVQAATQVLSLPDGSPSSDVIVEGSDLRQAATELLTQLASSAAGWDALRSVAGLSERLTTLQSAIQALPADDKECCQDELTALHALQAAMQGPRPAESTAGAEHSSHIPPQHYEHHAGQPTTTLNVNSSTLANMQLGVVDLH